MTNVDAPRLLLTFSGPATAVGKAFSTKIHKFKMKDGLAHYANVTNPKLPGRFYGAALKLNDFGGGTTNFAGMVIGPRSGQAAKAIGPAGQGATGADKTASGGTLLRSYGFSVTPGFQEPGVATPQTLSVTLQTKPGEAAPTGDISIYSGDSLGAIGTIAAKHCEAGDEATYTCAGLWTPPAEMPTGEHRLTAAYSGDARYAPTYTTSRIVSYGSELTSTTVTASTINTDSSQSITFTSVTTWTGSGAAPLSTDTVTLTCVDGSPNEGGMGCGNLSNLPAADPVSSCTVSTSAQTITCTFSYNLDNNDLYFGSFGFQASFSGDTTYTGSSATVFVDDYDPEYAGAGTLSITPSTAYPAPGSSVTYTTVYTATTQTTNPTTSGGPTYTDITGSPITGGELIDPGNASSCTWSTSAHTLTCTFSSLVPSGLSGFYTIGSEFSGNYLDEAQSASTTLLVTNGMSSTVNVSLNPNIVSGSSGTAVTVTYTLGWTGSTAPTGTLVLSDAQGTLPTQTVNLSSCTLGTNLYTCSYTWVAASTGTSSPDKVTASYSGDGNFLPSSGSANLTISSLFTGSNTVTVANLGLSANSSQTYGTAEAVNQLDVILTGQSGDGAPNGQIAFWFGNSSQIEYFLESNAVPDNKCLESSDMISCMSVPATTSAIMPVGNYYLWLSYAPENNVYKAVVSKTSSAVYKVNAATPTISFATSPITTPYGSSAYVPVTVNLGGVSATGATAPTGETVAVSVSSTADGEVAGTIGGTQGATATCVTVTTTAPQAACTVYFYPSATAGVQTIANYFSATVTGAAGNYSTNTTAVKDSLQITAATPTVTITPSPATTTVGSTTAIALTATIVGTGVSGDTAPTATPSFSAATGASALRVARRAELRRRAASTTHRAEHWRRRLTRAT